MYEFDGDGLRGWQQEFDQGIHVPLPAEIRKLVEQIQATWDKSNERRHRTGFESLPVVIGGEGIKGRRRNGPPILEDD